MSAKRLPGKPLLRINGKSIIARVFNKAKNCKIGKVIVATEDKIIANEIKKNGGKAILTSKKHNSGTDRIWEAFKKLKNNKIKYIINLQGDEPLLDMDFIDKFARFMNNRKANFASMCKPFLYEENLDNPNRVKVVIDEQNKACLLYTSDAADE